MWDEGSLLSRNAVREALLSDGDLPRPLGLAKLFRRLAGSLRDKRSTALPAREALV